MHIRPLARLTPISRERLIRRHLDEGVPLKALAAQAGSACAALTSGWRAFVMVAWPQQLQQAVDLRHQR